MTSLERLRYFRSGDGVPLLQMARVEWEHVALGTLENFEVVDEVSGL